MSDTYSLLLIEDSETNNILVQSIFEEHPGYTIDIATSGKEAFRYLKSTTPDLILLDLMLPDIDGFSILETLKKEPKNKDIPVVIVSAKDKPEDVKRGKKLGADDYVLKPIGVNNLFARVERVLEKRGK
jgi:DNA-binding response OmpR family regulator